MSKKIGDLIRKKFSIVDAELKKPDPNFVKFRCPICHGYGGARGALSSPALDNRSGGPCLYCGGTGVARRRKKK